MNIVFINYSLYGGCSGVHIHFLANALQDRGHRCFVALPVEEDDPYYFGTPRYTFLSVDDAIILLKGNAPLLKDAVFHAWTPREISRSLTTGLARLARRPYFVHLEDNEEYILESLHHKPFAQLEQEAREGSLVCNDAFIHPLRYREFLGGAAGVTCIIKALTRFVPEGVPTQVFWPSCEEAFFRIPFSHNKKVRQQLGLRDDETVLVYPGAVHAANAPIIDELFRALPLLAEQGYPVRLVRCGFDKDELLSPEALEARSRWGIQAGHVAAKELPHLIGAADILVQPGMPGPFDDCRFPSKLTFFLASGRPVITAPTNIGKLLRDGEHCLYLHDSSAGDIAAQVRRLMENRDLARRIGENGRAFARQHFSWERAAAAVESFYLKWGFPHGK